MPGHRIIDTHAHIFTRHFKMVPERRYTPGYEASLESLLGQYDANGASHGVLVQPSFYGTDNSCMLEGLQRTPTRLRGIAVIDPSLSAAGLRNLRNAGCVGMRLNLLGAALPDFNDPVWTDCLKRLADLNWIIEIQAQDAQWPLLLPALTATRLRIIIDHFGLPETAAGVGENAILAAAEGGNIWVKLSGPYRISAEAARSRADFLLRELGPERLMWGSDWPWTQHETNRSYAEVLSSVKTLIPTEADLQQILLTTPAKLFGFPEL